MVKDGDTPTTLLAMVISIAGTVYGVTSRGAVFEATDVYALGPAAGDRVVLDWLPSAGQWLIVAILP
jgi:hypothetical protein